MKTHLFWELARFLGCGKKTTLSLDGGVVNMSHGEIFPTFSRWSCAGCRLICMVNPRICPVNEAGSLSSWQHRMSRITWQGWTAKPGTSLKSMITQPTTAQAQAHEPKPVRKALHPTGGISYRVGGGGENAHIQKPPLLLCYLLWKYTPLPCFMYVLLDKKFRVIFLS